MAKTALNTIKDWFKTGKFPTQSQFWNWMDSFWHKDESIPISTISGLETELNNKASTESVSNKADLGSDGKVIPSQLPPASGMFFPQRDLTHADIGKVVVWKDGAVQLPEFEPEKPKVPGILKFKYYPDSFMEQMYKKETIQLTNLPTVGETITVDLSASTGDTSYTQGVFTFTSSTPASGEIEIGATVEDTVDNIIQAISNHNDRAAGLIVSKTAVDTLEIEWKWMYLGDYGNGLEFFSEGVPSLTTDVVNSVVSDNNLDETRHLGGFLDLYYIIKGMLNGGMNLGYYGGDLQLLKEIHSDSTNMHEAVYLEGTPSATTYYGPGSLEELMDAAQAFLEDTDEFEDVYWNPSRELFIVHDLDGDEGEEIGFEAPSAQHLYSEHWSGMALEQEFEAGTPPLCVYPIFGVLKNTQGGLAELYTEPILEYQASDLDEFEGLFEESPVSVFVLDSYNIGGVKSLLLTVINYGLYKDLFANLMLGQNIYYIASRDSNSFYGGVSSSMSILSIDVF